MRMSAKITTVAVTVCFMLGIILGQALLPQRTEQLAPAAAVGVLFIGTSVPYYHENPPMLADLARAGGQKPLYFECQTPGGSTLEKHWQDGEALARIRRRPWDFVVLQDQSQAPLLRREALGEFGWKF